MALPLLLAPIAGALTKIGGAALAKIGGAAALKSLGGTLAANAGSQLLSNGINQVFGGGNSGGSSVAPPEAQPVNIPQMALQNKMAEMKANTQPMQAQTVQPIQTNQNQDMLKQGLMDRLRFRRTGGIY